MYDLYAGANTIVLLPFRRMEGGASITPCVIQDAELVLHVHITGGAMTVTFSHPKVMMPEGQGNFQTGLNPIAMFQVCGRDGCGSQAAGIHISGYGNRHGNLYRGEDHFLAQFPEPKEEKADKKASTKKKARKEKK